MLTRICIQCKKPFQIEEDQLWKGNILLCSPTCVKERKREYDRKYQQTPKRQKYLKDYWQQPETKKAHRISSMKWHHGNGHQYCLAKSHEQSVREHYGLSVDEYAKRTMGCEICGWTLLVDLHHLDGEATTLPRKNDRRKQKDNNKLIALCPNHHWKSVV